MMILLLAEINDFALVFTLAYTVTVVLAIAWAITMERGERRSMIDTQKIKGQNDEN